MERNLTKRHHRPSQAQVAIKQQRGTHAPTDGSFPFVPFVHIR
jgi:hypothetical protein